MFEMPSKPQAALSSMDDEALALFMDERHEADADRYNDEEGGGV